MLFRSGRIWFLRNIPHISTNALYVLILARFWILILAPLENAMDITLTDKLFLCGLNFIIGRQCI